MSLLLRQLFPVNPYAWVPLVVQAMAWPAAVVAIAAMFRAEIRLVLERVVQLKYRNFEAQFRRDLSQAEALAEPPSPSPRPLLEPPGEFRRIIPESDASSRPDPRSRIEASWSDLASAADRAAGTAGIDPAPALAARGVLAGPDLIRFNLLRRLRDQVTRATDWSPSPADADRYAGLARPLAARLDGAAQFFPSGRSTMT